MWKVKTTLEISYKVSYCFLGWFCYLVFLFLFFFGNFRVFCCCFVFGVNVCDFYVYFNFFLFFIFFRFDLSEYLDNYLFGCQFLRIFGFRYLVIIFVFGYIVLGFFHFSLVFLGYLGFFFFSCYLYYFSYLPYFGFFFFLWASVLFLICLEFFVLGIISLIIC